MMEQVRLCAVWPMESWLFHEPHAGLDDCLNMILSCFRKRMSGQEVQDRRADLSRELSSPGGDEAGLKSPL